MTLLASPGSQTTQRAVRVLHVIDTSVIGGAELSFLDVAKSINRNDVIPHALYGPGERLDWFLEQSDKNLIKAHLFQPCSWRKRNPFPFALCVAQICRVIADNKIDLIHVNHPHYFLLHSYWSARLCRIPLVVHYQMMADDSEGQNWWRKVNSKIVSRADALIHISNACKISLEERGVSNSNTWIINNGVDTERFNQKKRSGALRRAIRCGSEPILGFVGRIVHDKGVMELLDAFLLLRERFPRLYLTIIGDYSSEALDFIGRLKSVAEQSNCSDRVWFAGFSDDVADYMADLDILALPSYHEGFGKVLIEAMASGVSVVASRVGGIPEVVRDKEDGLLVPVRNHTELAQAIASLLSNDELRLKMVESALNRTSELFSLDNQCSKTAELYHSLVFGGH